MIAFLGMVFVVSLYLQEERGVSPVNTGLAFVPVTASSIIVPILAARLAERFGTWVPSAAGRAAMGVGLFGLGVFAETSTIPALVAWMVPVGMGGGLAMPLATSLLLNNVPTHRTGTASGVLNTCRQVGEAIAIAAFGALITTFGEPRGTQASLVLRKVRGSQSILPQVEI